MKPTPHPHASAFASMSPFGPLCGLISDGKVWCKGSYGDPTLYKPPLLEGYPEFSETWRLFHSSEKITQIASGSGYVFALSETGRVGSLPIFFGYGYKTPQNQFYWNNSFRHVIQIASCGLSVCALLRDGTVRCTSQDSPPQAAPAASPLPGMERIVSINCSYGLRADGRAFSWEYPHSKWLSELTQIRQLVSAGGVFCALVVGSSAVLCWDPSPTSYSIALGRGRIHAASEEELNALKVPAPVVGLSGVVSLSLGRSALYAKTADGAWWGWGENSEGRLGDGTRERRYTPVKLLFQP